MKNRFTLIDVVAAVKELKKLEGMRVNNIYDIDNKTYLIKLNRPEEKAVLLLESGMRLHRTNNEWPKSQTPSSFTMKLRKHIKQKRLREISQIGNDRLVQLTFGDGPNTNHLILELYDRGNVVLTDENHVILNILRPRTDKDTAVRWAVKEKYQFDITHGTQDNLSADKLRDLFAKIEKEEPLARALAPATKYGAAVTKEALINVGINPDVKVKSGSIQCEQVIEKVNEIQAFYEQIWETISTKACEGFITYTKQARSDGQFYEIYQDYTPLKITASKNVETKTFADFCESVDEFYAHIETQKQEQRAMNVEKAALKKLDNVRKDQETRVEALAAAQEQQELMANRIIVNQDLVERALLLLRTALANQYSWSTIQEMQKAAAQKGDPVAKAIVGLNFDRNEFILRLSDPYEPLDAPINVPIDISMNASKNAQRYFGDKKTAADKVKKTLASSGKAIKNAQEKAKNTLDLVRVTTEVKRARKPMWFEKFRWFVSTEGYVVVGGRDAQQNELIVKKYLRDGDVYVHADVRGAASVVIRNKSGGGDIPPKTLTEAAQMAVCYSNAWEANVSAAAWWVRHDQVSRTAPTGEYLPSGSFMIRGKKNYLPPSQLVMGFALLFKLDEESIEKRKIEAKEAASAEEEAQEEVETKEIEEEVELEVNDDERGDKEDVSEEEEFPDVEISVPLTADEVTIIDVGPKKAPTKKVDMNREQLTKQYLEQKNEEQQKLISAKTHKRKQRKDKLVKQKYKDWTDDDKDIHLEFMQGRKKESEKVEAPEETQQNVNNDYERPKDVPERREKAPKEQEDDDDDDKEDNVDDSQAVLSSLTSLPREDDVLLFVVPVVAPYQAMSSYKYKVKLTPGTGKRGKATKSAIELFTRGKTGRESQLIKALASEEATARNLPGKVRVSAPQLHAK